MKEAPPITRASGLVLTGVALGILAVVAVGMFLVRLSERRVKRAVQDIS